jgi:hypothetical protein
MSSSAHRKPIVLYCSRPMQTQDDSEADSERREAASKKRVVWRGCGADIAALVKIYNFKYSTLTSGADHIKTWSQDNVSEQLKMSSNAHRKPIILYCSRPTQTQDDSEADSEESDFPPCLEGNCTPIMSRSSPAAVPSRYHCKPIVLHCGRPTQTRDDSEADSEESDFPPCLEGNCTPIMSRSSPAAVPSRYLPAATSGSQQQLTISGEKEPQSESQHRRLPNPGPGLGQMNVVNTTASATALNSKVVILYIS